MPESPERQFNTSPSEPEQIGAHWPLISEEELKYLNVFGGDYRGIVENLEGKRYEDTWRDVKVAYSTMEPIAKAVIETRAYGTGALHNNSDVEGYSLWIAFEPFDGGETRTFDFDLSARRIGVSQENLHGLAEHIHRDIVRGINTLPRSRSHIQGEIDLDIKDWKSEAGYVQEEFGSGRDPFVLNGGHDSEE